jgi:hypothetical protein|tara:strand:+ start:72 stop:674 length:603 start_codon:yes stop_codon:yes gene_type:complete
MPFNSEQPLSYEALLGMVADQRGWNPDQAKTVDSFRYNVGNHESINIPTARQTTGGPGRGKYQYEIFGDGGSGASTTAVNRLKNYFKRNDMDLSLLPETDREYLFSEDPDFSQVSEGTQDMLFLLDKVESPNAALGALISGDIDEATAWADWHWGGKDEKERTAKMKRYNDLMAQRKAKAKAAELQKLTSKPLSGGERII